MVGHPRIVSLRDLPPGVRRRLYWSCYARAVVFALIQALVVIPIEGGVLLWLLSLSGPNKVVIGGAALAGAGLLSVLMGYGLVVVYIRRTLALKMGSVRLAVVVDDAAP